VQKGYFVYGSFSAFKEKTKAQQCKSATGMTCMGLDIEQKILYHGIDTVHTKKENSI